MKKYTELTEKQQDAAKAKCLNNLLQNIIEGGIRFSDKLNDDDLQARIDKAGEKAEAMKTPWFVSEYIMDTCKEDLEGLALAEAEDSLYSEENENVINGIA